ncbi:MAG: hypothetical protein ABFD64_12065 [Armatimonadota bacterium]
MRALVILLVFLIPAIIIGCGSSVDQDTVVNIRDNAFDPTTLTVSPGTTVRFTNSDNTTHTIVSGSLTATSSPQTISVSLLDTQFSRSTLTVHLNDTVRFVNASNSNRQIEVKDNSNLDVVYLTPVLAPQESNDFRTTATGIFQVRDASNAAVQMTLTVEGVPNPDGRFSSSVLAPGEHFEFQFNTAGEFPFFCGQHNIEQGTIVVE